MPLYRLTTIITVIESAHFCADQILVHLGKITRKFTVYLPGISARRTASYSSIKIIVLIRHLEKKYSCSIDPGSGTEISLIRGLIGTITMKKIVQNPFKNVLLVIVFQNSLGKIKNEVYMLT